MEKHVSIGGFILALVIITTLQLFSQSQEIDVIYLKSGKIVSGKIVERIPDKTIVIETTEGIEFVDYVDIKRMQKEFIPKIESISPLSGEVGTIVSLNGSFPSSQPKDAVVYFGDIATEILFWDKNKINIRVPIAEPEDYVITVQIGNQKDIARVAYTVGKKVVTGKNLRARNPQKVVEQETPDEGYNTGGFWMYIGYSIPLGDFGKTDGFNNSGFAKKGVSIGYEGRIHLSQNFYLPLNFDVTYLSFNIEELQKQVPVTVSSEGKSHGLISFTVGLGFAIPLSSSSFLFVSSDVGPAMVHRPDTKYGTTTYTKFNSVNTFTAGYGFSGGITFADDVTFGYRLFSAKPKHKVEVSFSGSTTTSEIEIEQQVQIGQIYISFAW